MTHTAEFMKKPTFLLLALVLLVTSGYAEASRLHALSIFGDPKYPPDFTHFDYVRPDAPKGGTVTIAQLGSYDSFNPFAPKGDAPQEMGLTIATLMMSSDDEPSAAYGYVAEAVEIRAQGHEVVFFLNPAARFHDGTPINATDVKATFDYLRKEGQPFYAAYYHDVTSAEVADKQTIVFKLAHNQNRELPVILGQLPVLRAQEVTAEGDKAVSRAFTGSGPYRIKTFSMGQSMELERVPGGWQENLPSMKGRFNYDIIRVDWYRDDNVVLEALKSGRIDVNLESSAKRWATGYSGDAFGPGKLVKVEIPHKRPVGLQAFVMNSRRAQFTDARVRKALGLAFDFEWANANLFHGSYTRSKSYFSNSDCQAEGVPEGSELALLEPFRKTLPPALFDTPYTVPVTDGSGNARKNLRDAAALLKAAGWTVSNNKLVNKHGQPFVFDVLIISQDYQRIVLPYKGNLEKLGITMNVRLVDISKYVQSLRQFDFDMIIHSFPQSASPGNEQRDFWHSSLADQNSSRNVIGIKDPAVDSLIESLIRVDTREKQLAACRALDRVLLWGDYVIPQWYISVHRVAYRDRFGLPPVTPSYGDYGFYNWWITP